MPVIQRIKYYKYKTAILNIPYRSVREHTNNEILVVLSTVAKFGWRNTQ